MAIIVTKPKFNLREALNGLKQNLGIKGAELVRADTITDVYNSINPTGFKNLVHNGDFQVWQRGTTGTGSSGYFYVADRWTGYSYGSNSCTISRQSFTLGQQDVPGAPVYYARMTDTASRCLYTHGVEDLRRFSDQWVTLSFWIKSNISRNIVIGLHAYYGSSDAEGLLGATEWDTGVRMTPQWQKFTLTTKIKSFAGKTFDTNGGSLQIFITHSAGNPSTVDLANVQLEFGTTATPFERRPYATELALCQRYFETIDVRSGLVFAWASEPVRQQLQYTVEKRATPSATPQFQSISNIQYGGYTAPGASAIDIDKRRVLMSYGNPNTWVAQGGAGYINGTNTGSFLIYISAEY